MRITARVLEWRAWPAPVRRPLSSQWISCYILLPRDPGTFAQVFTNATFLHEMSGAALMVGACVLLRLTGSGAALTLRLFRDETRSLSAFVHAGGYGLSHVEPSVPAVLAAALGALASALETSGQEAWPPELMARLQLAVRRADARCGLQPHRLLWDDQVIPHWAGAARSGPPLPGSLWPFDAELAGLIAGPRQLLRREWAAGEDDARQRDAAWLRSHGLSLEEHPAEAERVVVLAARDANVLRQASRLEPEVERRGPQWEHAAGSMGALLGYPPCCVRAFVTARGRSDPALLAQYLPEVAHAPLPAENLWICGALALISHVPCEPACAATQRLAGQILLELERTRVGFEGQWRGLSARLHLMTQEGRMFLLKVSGSLLDSLRIEDALELLPGPQPTFCPMPELAGQSLARQGLWLGCRAQPWLRGTLFSDHSAR